MNIRNKYFDIVKSIAIFFVVFGHSIQYGLGSKFLNKELFFEDPFFIGIYSFHMPLFMLVSGYLFAYSVKKYDWIIIIKNKFSQLIVPLFFWSLVNFGINVLSEMKKGNAITLIWILKSVASNFIGGAWFLWAIWWCSFAVVIVNRFFRNSLIIYIMGFLLTFVIPDTYGLGLYKFMYPFFVLAFNFNYYELETKLNRYIRSMYLKICFFIIWMFMIRFYDYKSYIYTSGYTLLNKNATEQLAIDLYRFIIGLVGSIVVLYLIELLTRILRGRIEKALIFIGKNSMGIYLISGYIFSYILTRLTTSITDVNYALVLMEGILILLVSLLLTQVIRKFELANYMFLGGRKD